MSYIIWFLFVAIGILKPNSKIVNAIQKTWVVVMWGMASGIADISAYRTHFCVSQYDFTPQYIFLKEGIYRNFCCLFRNLGFSFDLYLVLLALFCVLAIDKTFNYFNVRQKGFVWSALMLYPMHEMNVTLQGRLAFCVILLGLRYLNKYSIKNMVLFGIHVIVAGCIHTGAYEFIILYSVYLLKNRKRAFTFISIGIISELLFQEIVKNMIYRFNVEGWRLIDAYFEGSGSYIRTIGHIIMYCFVILIASYGYRDIKQDDKTRLLHRIMWAMMLGYPLVILSTQLRRNLEVMFIVPYMCVERNVEKIYNLSNKIIIKLTTFILAIVIFLGLHVRNFDQFKLNYITQVINGNYIVQGSELSWRLLLTLVIFMFMFLFTEKYISIGNKINFYKIKFVAKGK